jgi:aerotaxis receptor
MRNNQPVTQQESIIPEGVFIYSRTDLKGQITQANKAFADISGFIPEEMVGQPHNIIRHPDMPPEAFEDLWRNLKAGNPWKGIVKNRRKDGGFYWVVANASPVRENGQVVGYQSVRTRPTREQIEAADKAYRRLKNGDKSIRVQDGRIVKNHSRFFEQSTSHSTQLYGFAMLTVLTEITGVITDHFEIAWLTSIHHVMSALLLLVALYMGFYHLPKSLGRLTEVHEALDKVLSSGNLTISLTPANNGLIGQISARLDTLIASVRATLQIMADSANEVSVATDSLNDSVISLAASATQQSETTSAAAAGVEELTVSISEVAHHAGNTREVAQNAGSKANEGAILSVKATESIRALSDTVARSAVTVEQLGGRTEEVGKVANVIKEIADQTNLLALNAAIEAARAGETGRGFAVVADEVRKLAERTAKATMEIDEMITRIQGDTHEAVNGMRQSAEQVVKSEGLVKEAHDTLQQINQQMDNTLVMVSEISHSSSEQSSAMAVMAKSVEDVAQLTEQNMSVARNTEASSRVLKTNVDRMKKAVTQYRV